jgi:hypothetical protein
MAARDEHNRDCEQLLGQACDEVNAWMDAEAKRFGPLHRFSRHHTGGVREAEEKFGPVGCQAALIHILKDCGHIPTMNMWKYQEVDSMGRIPGGRFNGVWDPGEFDHAAKALIEKDAEKPRPLSPKY